MELSLLHHHYLFVLLSVVLVAARATLPPHPSGTIDAGSKGEGVSVHQSLDDSVGKVPFLYKYDQQPLDDGVGKARRFFYKYDQQPLDDGVGEARRFFYKYDQQPLDDGVGKARRFFYKYEQQPLDDGVGKARRFFYKYDQQPLDDGVGKARRFFYKYDQQPLDDGMGKARRFFYKYDQQPLDDGVGTARRFFYKYDQQPHRDGGGENSNFGPNNEGWFLLEQDLKAGHKVKLDFITQDDVVQRPFLSPQLAKSIPFSTTKFDEILKRLNVEPGSHDADIMKQNIMDCEALAIKGEHKHCATSLESMVGFATSQIGKEVEALSTKVVKKETTSSSGKKEYRISSGGVKKVADNTVVGCHRMEYPYAVYYCHKTEMTRAYTVPLEGDDGVRVKAVAVCHTDTSQWNPNHIAFQLLKVKPGTGPICHFIPPQDTLIWVPKRLQIL